MCPSKIAVTAAIQAFDHKMRAMAWSVVRFLVEEDAGRERGKFRAFVGGLANGVALDEALAASYGFDTLDRMEQKWIRWARSRPVEEEEGE